MSSSTITSSYLYQEPFFDDDYEKLSLSEPIYDDSLSSSVSSSSTASSSDEIDTDHDVDECLSIPDHDVLIKIVKEIENYFTDENLIKDEFLVKSIRRNKDGYVNISLVAKLRRIKSLVRGYRETCELIAYAIDMYSNTLELHPNGKKIRRQKPLASIDDKNKYNRTVIIIGLPEQKSDVDVILNDLSTFGFTIQAVRIFDSNVSYPSHKKLFHNHNLSFNEPQEEEEEIRPKICTIEFNQKSDAEKFSKSHSILMEKDSIWSEIQICYNPTDV